MQHGVSHAVSHQCCCTLWRGFAHWGTSGEVCAGQRISALCSSTSWAASFCSSRFPGLVAAHPRLWAGKSCAASALPVHVLPHMLFKVLWSLSTCLPPFLDLIPSDSSFFSLCHVTTWSSPGVKKEIHTSEHNDRQARSFLVKMDVRSKLEHICVSHDVKIFQLALTQAGKECCVYASPLGHQPRTEIKLCCPSSSSSAVQDTKLWTVSWR